MVGSMIREKDRLARYDFERDAPFQLTVEVVRTSKAACAEWERLVTQDSRAGIAKFCAMACAPAIFFIALNLCFGMVGVGWISQWQGACVTETAFWAITEPLLRFFLRVRESMTERECRRKDILRSLGVYCKPSFVATDKTANNDQHSRFLYILRPY